MTLLIDRYIKKKDDEEERLRPSQKARIEQRSKRTLLIDRYRPPEPAVPKKKKKTFGERVKGVGKSVKKFFLGEKPIVSPVPGKETKREKGVFETFKKSLVGAGVPQTIGGLQATGGVLLSSYERWQREEYKISYERRKGKYKKASPEPREIITLTKPAKKLKELAKKNTEKAQFYRQTNLPILSEKTFSEGWKDPEWVAAGLGSNVVPLITSIGVSATVLAITKNPALATSTAFGTGFALEAGNAYQDAQSLGVDEEKAENIAIMVGVVNGALEGFPIMKLLTRSPQGQIIKRSILRRITGRLSAIATQSALEAATESLQEITANAFAQEYDENRELFQGVPESAFFGGILGGGVGIIEIPSTQKGQDIQSKLEEAKSKPEAERTTEEKELIKAMESVEKDNKAFQEVPVKKVEKEPTTPPPSPTKEGEKVQPQKPVKEAVGEKVQAPKVKGGVGEIKTGLEPQRVTIKKEKLQRIKGETADQAIARKVGYQIENGVVKLEPETTGTGWKATIAGLGDNDISVIRGFKKEQVLQDVFKKLYPNIDLTKQKDVVQAPISDIPKELEPLAKEARKYKSAEEFADEYSRNNPVIKVRETVAKFDKVVDDLNAQLTGKYQQLDKMKGKKVIRQVASGKVRNINVIDRKLFKETKRALTDFYNQATKEVKPVKPPVEKPAKPKVAKVDERTQEVVGFIEAKIGKPIEKATVKEIRDNLPIDEVLPLNEKSQVILKKIASPVKGSDTKNLLTIRPALVYGGVSRNMFTDGFLLIQDKQAAKKLNQEIIAKEEKTKIKGLQYSDPSVTYKQAEKMAKDDTQSKIEEHKEKYPDVSKVIPEKYSKRETKILGFNNYPYVYLSNGESNVVINGNMLAFMQKRLPNAKIRLTGNNTMVVFEKNGKIAGLAMPIRADKPFPFKEGKLKKVVQKTKASADLYADLPNFTQQEAVKRDIPFPEMVRLAKDLMGKYPVIKTPRKRKAIGRPYGLFIPKDDGTIVLNPEIFKNIDQSAKTLAHEIGHLTDYLPDKVTARGNLLGRIATLRKFMRHKFTNTRKEKKINKLIEKRSGLQEKRRALEKDTEGKVIKSLKSRDLELLRKIRPINKRIRVLQENAIKIKEVKDELKALSVLWKPFQKKELVTNPETGEQEIVIVEAEESEMSEDYLTYRYSPEELYADAISVLLNDPALLKKEAPIFHKAFFEELHRKPNVQKEYFELMDFLNQPDDVVQTRRLDTLYEGFKEAREKRVEIELKKKPRKPWLDRLMAQHVTRFDPIYKKMDEKFKGYGLFVSPKTKLRMQLEEMQMRENDAYLYFDKINKDIVDPIEKVGLTEDDLGIILTLERNLAGRKDIANPYGLQGKYSQETLDYFKKYLEKKKGITDEQFNILQQVAQKFRIYQFNEVKNAREAQLYSLKNFKETLEPNQYTYAPYIVIEYIHNNYVSAGIKRATGTLKQIENPFVSSVLKTMAVMNQTEIQKGKLEVIKQLHENFPEDISKSKALRVRAGVRVAWKPVENRTALELYEDGKRTAYDVDPYIARMFDFYSPTEVHSLVQVSGKFNRVFKPLVTTWNVSWGFYSNILRDTRRTYKNLATILPNVGEGKGLSIFEFVHKWISAIPEGVRFQRGNLTPLLEDMIKNKGYVTSFASFNAQANEDKAIAPIMRKSRFLQPKNDVKDISMKKKLYKKTLGKVLGGIEFAASTFETTTKAAAYQITQERVNNGKLAGFITRNYAGTPNFIDGGTQKYIDNQIFVFSNVMIQGVRTDAELGTNPTTRSGYWARTFVIDMLPKIMMVMAMSGLFGEKLKEMYDKMTEYDKTNYITIPVGMRENGKVVYWRIPQDETGRFWGALTWKIGSYLSGEGKKPEQIFALGAGYIPSVTPMWEVAGAWLNYIQGRNPYDSYRGRQVIDDLTWRAGGLPVFEKMIQYTTNNLGLSQFTTYSDDTDTTFDMILKQTPLINRALRSTDYGLTEKEKAIKKELGRESARRILKERELLEDAIKQAKEEPENKMEIKASLIKEAVGDKPYDTKQKTRETNLKKKFEVGLIKGQLGREMDSLIGAGTNDYKVELLKMYKQSMDANSYKELVKDALRYKVISEDVVRSVRQDKSLQEGKPQSSVPVSRVLADLLGKVDKALVGEVYASEEEFERIYLSSSKSAYEKKKLQEKVDQSLIKTFISNIKEIVEKLNPNTIIKGKIPEEYRAEYSKTLAKIINDVDPENDFLKPAPIVPVEKPDPEKEKIVGKKEISTYTDKYFPESEKSNIPRVLDGENGKRNAWAENTNTHDDGTTSIDRGIFQINSRTFADFYKPTRHRKKMKRYGITSYNDMYDPEKNIAMASIIWKEQGWCGWYGAPDDLVGHCEWFERIRGYKYQGK